MPRAGQSVDLCRGEFKLLEYFMRRPSQIVTRAMLLEDVWNFKFMAQTNVVDVQIGNCAAGSIRPARATISSMSAPSASG